MTTTQRKPLFVQCQTCGEIWKWCTLPVALTQIPNAPQCPNCGERKEILTIDYPKHLDQPSPSADA